ERALKFTMAQSLFQKADPRQEALRDLIDEVLRLDDAGSPIAALISGLEVTYDLGEGHPLVGRRMPDLDIVVEEEPVRVFELMHQAHPLLLQFDGTPTDFGILPEHVDHVRARYDGAWELPVLGAVDAPSAVLVRPDGYVAWVGEGSTDGLGDALERWCGVAGRDHRHE
ncbi:aromatic-ring hydroxylase C-terminal domain-containing protein, partial [Rhodococcus sp. R1101]|uniref:aromatic-ring hydroxylase C-terminal domain-containing protein n=1 Tax=Rhodococcus sp. R1101 TaxID=1170698 RepID=UPI0003708B59